MGRGQLPPGPARLGRPGSGRCAAGAADARGGLHLERHHQHRDFDAAVARTRSLISSGQVAVRQAVIWMGAQMALAGLVLLSFNWVAILLGLSSLGLVALYPFAKRFTWWPQLFLGLAFSGRDPCSCAAHSGTVTVASVLLYASGVDALLIY